MPTGTVKSILYDRGFGFIKSDGDQWFFHRLETKDFNQLEEGDEVTFEPTLTPKGPRANNVARKPLAGVADASRRETRAS